MVPKSVRLACDRGSYATFGHPSDDVTKNELSLTSPCFRRHVKPLVSAAFTAVSNVQSALGPRGGLWLVLLM
jgi:hypothetical protein